jgi:hypothetical protein
MAKAKSTLLDEIQAAGPVRSCGYLAWNERLADDLRAEVEEVKRAYLAGEIRLRASQIARILAEKLSSRAGIDVKHFTISRWLRNAKP